MKIAYVSMTPVPHTGGLWSFLSQISAELGRTGHDVELVSPAQMPALWRKTIQVVVGLARTVLPSWSWFFVRLVLTASFLRLLIIRQGLHEAVDVFDAQDPMSFLAIGDVPHRLLTIHGYFHHEASMGALPQDSLWTAVLRRIESLAYESAPIVVTVDRRLKDYVASMGIPRSKIIVRFNAVDCDFFQPATEESARAARDRFGIRDRQKVLACARRLEEKCGVLYAILAIEVLASPESDKILLIAGTGSQEDELRQVVAERRLAENVRFLGELNRQEIRLLLQAADAATVPSVTVGEEVEATSLSALEAMASGLPVVACGIGGLKDLITDGVDGILVPERDALALAHGIQRALTADGKRIGRSAREMATARFSVTRQAEHTIRIYQSLIQDPDYGGVGRSSFLL